MKRYHHTIPYRYSHLSGKYQTEYCLRRVVITCGPTWKTKLSTVRKWMQLYFEIRLIAHWISKGEDEGRNIEVCSIPTSGPRNECLPPIVLSSKIKCINIIWISRFPHHCISSLTNKSPVLTFWNPVSFEDWVFCKICGKDPMVHAKIRLHSDSDNSESSLIFFSLRC